MKTPKARLDADKSAKPKSRIVGHTPNDGACHGPSDVIPVAYQNDDGARVEFAPVHRVVKPSDKFSVTLRADEIAVLLRMLEKGEQAHPVDGPFIADKIRAQIAPILTDGTL